MRLIAALHRLFKDDFVEAALGPPHSFSLLRRRKRAAEWVWRRVDRSQFEDEISHFHTRLRKI